MFRGISLIWEIQVKTGMFPVDHGRRERYIGNGPWVAESLLNGGGLLPEKLSGEQDPEAKQSNEGSGGDDNFHGSLLRSRLMIPCCRRIVTE